MIWSYNIFIKGNWLIKHFLTPIQIEFQKMSLTQSFPMEKVAVIVFSVSSASPHRVTGSSEAAESVDFSGHFPPISWEKTCECSRGAANLFMAKLAFTATQPHYQSLSHLITEPHPFVRSTRCICSIVTTEGKEQHNVKLRDHTFVTFSLSHSHTYTHTHTHVSP